MVHWNVIRCVPGAVLDLIEYRKEDWRGVNLGVERVRMRRIRPGIPRNVTSQELWTTDRRGRSVVVTTWYATHGGGEMTHQISQTRVIRAPRAPRR